MKRPSFQFYPADWRNNAKLRRCSEAARGVWMDVLCVLHDSDEYGVCRWPLADLARAANAPLKLVKELAAKQVLKGADKSAEPYVYTPRHAGKNGAPVTLVEPGCGPCWYCSRFVRDEWVRQRRGGSTQFTTDNQPTKVPPNATPKGGIGDRQGDGPTSPSTATLLTPTTNARAAADTTVVFAMHPDWSPGPSFEVQAKLAGLPVKDAEFMASGTREFVGYWLTQAQESRTQAEWEHSLAQRLKHLKAGTASAAPRQANRRPSSHAGFDAKDYNAGVNADGTLA